MSSIIQQLPPEFARRHLRTGKELAADRRRRPEDGRLTTGVESLDRLLGGGLKRGVLSEITGRGGGRFALALAALARATGGGDAAALIDLGDALDPQAAAGLGLTLERLLWVRPRRLKEALASAEAILTTGMPLVVMDLGLPPVPGGRGIAASWLRLARAAQEQRTALLISSPYRVSDTAAHSVVELRRPAARWTGRGREPRLLDGLKARLSLVKGPGWHTMAPADLEWRVDSPVAVPSPASEKMTMTPTVKTQTSATRPQTSAATSQVPATRTQVPAARNQVPATRAQAPAGGTVPIDRGRPAPTVPQPGRGTRVRAIA